MPLTLLDEALILHSEVIKLEHPTRRTREAVIEWVKGGKPRQAQGATGQGVRDVQFLKSGQEIYTDQNDLSSLHPAGEDDIVSRFVFRWAGWLFKVCIQPY